MTRNQAIQILENQWAACQDSFGLVTAMHSLGILKLDEPMTAEKKFREMIYNYLNKGDADAIIGGMEVRNLKIVEK